MLPLSIREQAVECSSEKGHYFVATTQEGEIIGYKKLFIIKPEEVKSILADEIRCIERDERHIEPESKGVVYYIFGDRSPLR